MFDTIIKNGNVVLPQGQIIKASLGISNGRIEAIMTSGSEDAAATDIIDASGKYIFPGIIETHSHLGLAAGDGDLQTETAAAALGGVTTVLFFLRQPEPYDELYKHIIKKAAQASSIDYSFHIVLITEEHLQSIPRYVEELGITSFKFYLTYRGNEAKAGLYGGASASFPGLDDGYMLDCFRALSAYPQALAIVHAEDIEIVNREKAKMLAAGRDDMQAYALSRPPFAEAEGVRRALYFGRKAGCRVNILHLTSKDGLNAFYEESQQHKDFFIEVCHPYLTLDETDVTSNLFKVRPPLRTAEDCAALWEALLRGDIMTVGSDHVPRKAAEKQGSVWTPPAGAPGTQYLFMNMLLEAHFKRGLPLPALAKLLCQQPAELYGLTPRKGNLLPGCDADLLIVDFGRETVLQMENYPSYSDYNLFEGKKIPAFIERTMVRGRTIAHNGKLTGETGGEFIFRTSN